ncbi:DUF6233 domain-containing protein [Streptomyces sp. CB03238]|uniref:DUF6233 domain-containing protein n=1 Tax=Streptomyces sp. CB03238 TaxID=1907777 RepID=UPI001F4E5DCB|nr:DUF6233 domain-containing protein [Streptomyces sp. CB03238]
MRAPIMCGRVDGVDDNQVATERFEPSPRSAVREVLGELRPSGWMLQKARGGRGPAGGVLHASDCKEASQDAPLLSPERALDLAQNPATRLCSLWSCAPELTPMLHGFDHITDS